MVRREYDDIIADAIRNLFSKDNPSLVSGEKTPIVFNKLKFNKLQDKNYFSIRTRKFAERH